MADKNKKLNISTIEEIIEEARNGRMYILVDDPGRENEGDLIIPAQMATPDAINFMAKYGRGLICLSMTKQRIEELELPLMNPNNQKNDLTAFTVSIEAKEGVTTGISAAAIDIAPSLWTFFLSHNSLVYGSPLISTIY